ncbi:MAG: rod shape-determining protein [Thermaerobacter sp.]|nr:rod shape-determining protein [Thermaerobacter sp.]
MRRLLFDFGSETIRMTAEGSKNRKTSEPAVVAHHDGGNIIAVGVEAQRMLGRTPHGLLAERPFAGGGVRSQRLAQALLKALIGRTARSRWQRPEIVVALASGATALDRRAFWLLAREAGAARVAFAQLAACRALGLELPLFEPRGTLVVDVGASRTQIDLLSLGRTVVSATLPEAGDTLDEAIVRRLREEYNMMVGPATAQVLKHDLLGNGSADAVLHGRDLVSGLPRALRVQRAEIEAPARQLAAHIASAIQELLREASPELVSDVAEDGIYLTGGGSRLLTLRKHLPDALGLPMHCDETPDESIVRGLDRLTDRRVREQLLRRGA